MLCYDIKILCLCIIIILYITIIMDVILNHNNIIRNNKFNTLIIVGSYNFLLLY